MLMLKVRYFRLRFPAGFDRFREAAATRSSQRQQDGSLGIQVLKSTASDLILSCKTTRFLTTTQFLDDGSSVKTAVPTAEMHSLRIFAKADALFISVLNPARGLRIVDSVLAAIANGSEFFFEPLEISQALIDAHVAHFSSARLVSAKVRDFNVYQDAVGRLEVSSRSGLPQEIAPFLSGKFYRTDSLTYEVTHDFVQGLIWYSSNGTVRASGPLVEVAFPMLEGSL